MPKHDQRKAAIEFCSRWEGRGDEQSETQLFWNDLLQNVYGVPATSLPSFVNYEKRVRG